MLDGTTGAIARMGVVKTSGITTFDIVALASVDHAAPFGPAPRSSVSLDGDVYLHSEFHRSVVFACSTRHTRPFLLAAAPSGP